MKPTTIIEVPIETLKALKDALPHGSLEKIVERVGKSRQYVNSVFNGDQKINPGNYCIIKEAQAILEKAKHEAKNIDADIKKTLEA